MSRSPKYISDKIKSLASRHGFEFCGLSNADFLESEAPKLENWLSNNMQGNMTYMENHFDKRLDPRKLVEGCKTVISLVYNYFPSSEYQPLKDSFKVSKYAFGIVYQLVINYKMKLLWDYLQF